MREHKYRAWDTVKKIMYSAEELGADQETLSPDGRGFINVSGISTRLSEYHTHLLPLEFTGLKDKNGIEIYEGDVVKLDRRSNEQMQGKVEYSNNLAAFIVRVVGYGMLEPFPLLLVEAGTRIVEVIGNIYENEELLEK